MTFARRPLFALRALAAALSLAALAPRADAGEAPAIELVQTVPAETDLALKELRHAKDVWVDMIDGAKSTIDCAQFYVTNKAGSDLDKVLAALERAAKRGVKVRVMLSATPKRMLDGDPTSVARLKAMPGAILEALDLSDVTGGILHAKYWVVDAAEVYVGSQNLDWRSLSQIHELGLRIRDARIAAELGRIFERDLALAQGRKLADDAKDAPAAGSATARPEVELVASPAKLNPKGTRSALEALQELLAGARTSVDIQLLDFDTFDRYSREKNKAKWTDIEDALRATAARGVKVRMLLSHWNTERKALGALKKLAEIKGLEIRISEFPRSEKEGFIPYARVAHSKFMVVDGGALWVGTSNWLKDYFTASRNVELIVRKPEVAQQGAAVFERLWASKYASAFDPAKSYPAPEKGEPRKEKKAKPEKDEEE